MPDSQKLRLRLEIGHVLFMDIVGYSKLLVDEQVELVQELGEMVNQTEAVREAEAAGQLIRLPSGDGMAVVFTNSVEAPVECALEMSAVLQTKPNLPLRMGIHSGPLQHLDDVNARTSLAGAGINMAQRVMDYGDAGHILVSRRVADDLAQFRHWQPFLHDLGDCEVKHGVVLSLVNFHGNGLGNPAVPEKVAHSPRAKARPPRPRRVPWHEAVIALLLIGTLAAGAFIFFRQPARSVVARSLAPAFEKSVAVLPFANLSGDPDNAYFAEGIQDEILTRLAKIADLKVISRTSTQHYKSTPENLPEIARQLGVTHVVEGSVQKNADTVRVNVQLIRAADDSHLWADTYDRKLTDIFSVETEVAKAIAEQMRAKLTGAEEESIAAKQTDNPEAYDAYLRGLACFLKASNTSANFLAAQKYLREAVRLDPKFALCWALLSSMEARGYVTLNLQPTLALREEIRQAADTAFTLQPTLGEALMAKGRYYYSCLKEYDTAVRYFEEARRVLPNSSQIAEALAYVARRRGQWQQSEAYFNEAERLDPRNVYLLAQHAQSYVVLRRFAEAERKFDQVLEITPDDVGTLIFKAAIAQAEGDLPRAAALLAPLRPAADDSTALETQVYQAILERRPAPAIPRLQELLAKPDAALGFINGELRFWLGWAQEVAGQRDAAQKTWRLARDELEPFLAEQPDNFQLIEYLALTEMSLGNTARALALVDHATAAVKTNAVYGPIPDEMLARICARTGDSARSIAALQKLLATPYGGAFGGTMPLTPALLRLDPMFDRLRGDPRFEILASAGRK